MAGLGRPTTTPSPGYRYCHSERVRLGHTDGQRIVYHGTYLLLAEAARVEYMRDLGVDYLVEVANRGLDFAVAEVSVKYHAPASFDDILDIWVRVSQLRRVQYICDHEIRHRGSNMLLTSIRMHVACLDPARRRPARIPQAVIEAFREHEGEWLEDLTGRKARA